MKIAIVALLSTVSMAFLVGPSHARHICITSHHRPIPGSHCFLSLATPQPKHSNAWIASQVARGRPCVRFGTCAAAPAFHPFRSRRR
jgi:hypothetical protein